MARGSSRLARRLVWLAAVVLVVPWLGFQSLEAMKGFLVEGQEQAQLLTARGIATLLGNRPELFEDLPGAPTGVTALPLYPSRGHKVLDGYADDWRALRDLRQTFGEAGAGPRFSLLLTEQGRWLYGLVEVSDTTPVSRHPGVARLDRGDHLRLHLRDRNGDHLRLLLAFEGNGSASVWRMRTDWRYPKGNMPETGARARVVAGASGYDLEFRLPLAWLGQRQQLGLSVVDRAGGGREPRVTSTFQPLTGRSYNPVIARSAEVEALLRDFAVDNARLWLVDDRQRVRAVVGDLQPPERTVEAGQPDARPWWQLLLSRLSGLAVGQAPQRFRDFDPDTVHTRNDAVYRRALAGEAVARRRRSLDGEAGIITAAQPISAEGRILGVLLLEKSTDRILQLQRRSLETLAGLTVLGTGLVSGVLLAFALWLTWRIRRLGRDAAANVDDTGRLREPVPLRDSARDDEIGELGRTIDTLLERLVRHQGFLANIPRTLRHEINNPLNTIATSLDRLEGRSDGAVYLDSARRGLDRIGHVVDALAEAASLEEALDSEDRERLDLAHLLRTYLYHQAALDERPPAVDVPGNPVWVRASGEHLEMLLDKLLDNARDFSRDAPRTGEPAVRVSLTSETGRCRLQVANRGPLIPERRLEAIFQLMSGERSGGGHFGIGLYVARVIAEHHGGRIRARNRPDGGGVVFEVVLPLAPGDAR